ncbi:unnamed protein product [Tenebrio molitor]|nr:unnamed protein product [Tenebrio molitor]
MTALPFMSLIGHNLREILLVDCAYVQDITKAKTIFECLCPIDMKVVSIHRCFPNGEHPCSWELLYAYRPVAQKDCTPEDAKNAYQEILKLVPVNVSVKEDDKQLIGMPLKYRVQYSVDTWI